MAYSLKAVAEAGIPIGTIVAYYGSNPPAGWLICDGRSCAGTLLAKQTGKNNVPDLRGRFIRMVGGNSAAMAVAQGDCIRNITGNFNPGGNSVYGNAHDAFYTGARMGSNEGGRSDSRQIYFDASRVVPTGPENRPVNMAFNYIIKADYSLRIISILDIFKEVA